MILKNIFGKTVEAAKKTAFQMYGDDILILEASEATSDSKKARITIFSDSEKQAEQPAQDPRRAFRDSLKQEEEGVQFERSGVRMAAQEKKESPKLASLRKYATEQIIKEKKETLQKEPVMAGSTFLPQQEEIQEKTSGQFYRRANLRPAPQKNIQLEEEEILRDETPEAVIPKTAGKFITHFRESKPKESPRDLLKATQSPIENQKAIKALHKRFDKLEALLDSSLISANIDYACHPVFQQLVQTGINTSTVSGWFSEIIKGGVDPFDQTELFMAKIAGLLRDSLGKAVTKEPSQFMLFAGPSGSGKTTQIMKLCTHPDFMLNKKVAVVSIHPQSKSGDFYYSILGAFCADNEIPHFEVKKGLDVSDHLEAWKEFDHVLIDTPSLSIEQEESFRDYWKIRQLLTPVTPLEVHFVVNAARSKFYFANATAKNHPMQPDYISITHLDEITQWGPIIPFMKEMGCAARYISTGTSLPTSLMEFNPQWFAQKVLEA
jgi:flagellar biosynthesis GTPase FlhF